MTATVEPAEPRLLDPSAREQRLDDQTTANGRPVLRAVGPGFDAGASEVAVTRLALERLSVARTPGVVATDPWALAGRKVLRYQLARMLAPVPATMAGVDPEAVHDMRVAARRVRAAWRVFGGAYDRPVVRRNVATLRTLGDRLGAVRDIDVQLAILAAYGDRQSHRERAALLPLVGAWTADRAKRQAELKAYLGSNRFGLLVADHEAFSAFDRPADPGTEGRAPATVRTRTPGASWKAYATVWAFEADVADADIATLHDLRIATKWLRYTLEFVREPIEPAATELIRRVVVLQDHLGDIHDLHAAAEVARLAIATGPELPSASQAATTRFATKQDARVERLRRNLGPPWRGVADAEFRRSLGRVLARS